MSIPLQKKKTKKEVRFQTFKQKRLETYTTIGKKILLAIDVMISLSGFVQNYHFLTDIFKHKVSLILSM